MRLKSVVRPVRADTLVKVVRVQRVGISLATSREQAAQARAAQAQTDPRALPEAVVDVLVAAPVDQVVVQGDNQVVAQEASRPGNPDLEQVANQGEADPRVRGNRCSSTKRPEKRRVNHWGIHSLVPPNDSSQNAYRIVSNPRKRNGRLGRSRGQSPKIPSEKSSAMRI
jgi:hypothetical protein